MRGRAPAMRSSGAQESRDRYPRRRCCQSSERRSSGRSTCRMRPRTSARQTVHRLGRHEIRAGVGLSVFLGLPERGEPLIFTDLSELVSTPGPKALLVPFRSAVGSELAAYIEAADVRIFELDDVVVWDAMTNAGPADRPKGSVQVDHRDAAGRADRGTASSCHEFARGNALVIDQHRLRERRTCPAAWSRGAARHLPRRHRNGRPADRKGKAAMELAAHRSQRQRRPDAAPGAAAPRSTSSSSARGFVPSLVSLTTRIDGRGRPLRREIQAHLRRPETGPRRPARTKFRRRRLIHSELFSPPNPMKPFGFVGFFVRLPPLFGGCPANFRRCRALGPACPSTLDDRRNFMERISPSDHRPEFARLPQHPASAPSAWRARAPCPAWMPTTSRRSCGWTCWSGRRAFDPARATFDDLRRPRDRQPHRGSCCAHRPAAGRAHDAGSPRAVPRQGGRWRRPYARRHAAELGRAACRRGADPLVAFGLRRDVARLLSSLTPACRQVALALTQMSATEAARALGLNRSTIYARLAAIRAAALAHRARRISPPGPDTSARSPVSEGRTSEFMPGPRRNATPAQGNTPTASSRAASGPAAVFRRPLDTHETRSSDHVDRPP